MQTLSILDTGFVNHKYEDVSDVYNTLFELIEISENLGFSRYWLAEHYANNLAWNKPDIILPLLLASTNTINVGIAGIMFRYREVFRTACEFNVLNALFPNRVDLGLASGNPVKEILDEIDIVKNEHDIESWFQTFCKQLENDKVVVIPKLNIRPNIWGLGSGGFSFKIAKKYDFNYCFSLCHLLGAGYEEEDLIEGLIKVKEAHPKTSVLISGCIAETKEKAVDNYDKYMDRIGTHVPTDKGKYNVFGTQKDFYKKIEYITSLTGVTDFVYKDLNLSKNRQKSIQLIGEVICKDNSV